MSSLKYINEKFGKSMSRFEIGEPINGIKALSAGFVLNNNTFDRVAFSDNINHKSMKQNPHI